MAHFAFLIGIGICGFGGGDHPHQRRNTHPHTVHKYLNISGQPKHRLPGVVGMMLPCLRTLQQMHGNPIKS